MFRNVMDQASANKVTEDIRCFILLWNHRLDSISPIHQVKNLLNKNRYSNGYKYMTKEAVTIEDVNDIGSQKRRKIINGITFCFITQSYICGLYFPSIINGEWPNTRY